MSTHKPASLPLQARIKPTLNLRPAVRGVAIEQNQIARRVVESLHRQILDNPEPSQRYRHQDVAEALGLDPRKVCLSLAHAGGDWITVEVSAKDRAAVKKAMRGAATAR